MLIVAWIVAVVVLASAAFVLLMDSTRISRPRHPRPPWPVMHEADPRRPMRKDEVA